MRPVRHRRRRTLCGARLGRAPVLQRIAALVGEPRRNVSRRARLAPARPVTQPTFPRPLRPTSRPSSDGGNDDSNGRCPVSRRDGVGIGCWPPRRRRHDRLGSTRVPRARFAGGPRGAARVRQDTRPRRVSVRCARRGATGCGTSCGAKAHAASEADRRREAARRATAETRATTPRSQAREERAFRQMSPATTRARATAARDRGHACEVRDTRLTAPAGPLTVDASPNGGIHVEAGIRPTCWCARWCTATATTTPRPGAAARSAGHRGRQRVSRRGPGARRQRRRSGWSVSFRIWAPRQTALALSARNGGITVRSMRGESRFTTNNGGVTLDDMSGQVVGTTRNGGVNVRLSRARWEGDGLDVETTNGGVSLAFPARATRPRSRRTRRMAASAPTSRSPCRAASIASCAPRSAAAARCSS